MQIPKWKLSRRGKSLSYQSAMQVLHALFAQGVAAARAELELQTLTASRSGAQHPCHDVGHLPWCGTPAMMWVTCHGVGHLHLTLVSPTTSVFLHMTAGLGLHGHHSIGHMCKCILLLTMRV